MKDYHHNEEKTIESVHNDINQNHVQGKGGSGAIAPIPFSVVGLLDPHVLQSPLLEKHDDFIERCFKEWEAWVNDYNYRAFERRQRPPFTLTDWPTP
jgi:hypothetical protein